MSDYQVLLENYKNIKEAYNYLNDELKKLKHKYEKLNNKYSDVQKENVELSILIMNNIEEKNGRKKTNINN